MSSRIIDVSIQVGVVVSVIAMIAVGFVYAYKQPERVDPALLQSLYRECIQQVAASPIACKDAAIKIAERSAAQ